MFSNNDKISSRQIKRLLIFDLFGTGSLLLPSRLAQTGTETGIWCIVSGTGMACVYLWMIHRCFCSADQDYFCFLKNGWGNFLAGVLYAGYAAVSLAACAWAAKLLSELMCGSLLDNSQFPTALFLIVLLAVYGGAAGLEARARIYEIMFWVLVIPLAVMLLLCIRQVQTVQWFPLAGPVDAESFGRFWDGSLRCFACSLPLTFLLFLVPHAADKKNAGRMAYGALAAAAAALAAIYLILLGIFGSGALAEEEYPVITLMGMVKIPGDFVKRLDTVMVGVWFFTLYALIGTTLYYSVFILRSVFEKKRGEAAGADQQKDKKRRWCWHLAAAAAVYAAAYSFRMFPQIQELAEKLFYAAAVPFLVLVPAVSLFLGRIQRGKKNHRRKQERGDYA